MSFLYDLRNVVVAATVGAAFGYALARLPAPEGQEPDQGAYIRKLLAEIEVLKADRKKLESQVQRLLEESEAKTIQLEQQATVHSTLPAHESRSTADQQDQTESESATKETSELIARCQSLQRQLEAATAAAAAERRQHDERCRLLEENLKTATPVAEGVKHSDEEFMNLRMQLETRLSENRRLEDENKQLSDRARELEWQLEAKVDEAITPVQAEQVQTAPPTADHKEQLKEKEKFMEKLIEENKQLDEQCRVHADQMKQLELRLETASQGAQEQTNRCEALEKELQTARKAAEEGQQLAARCAELEQALSASKGPVEELAKASVALAQEAPVVAATSPVQEAARGMDDQTDDRQQLREKEQFAEKLMEENAQLEEQCRTYADQLKQLELQLATAREQGPQEAANVATLQQQPDAVKTAESDVASQAEVIKDLQEKAEAKERELEGYKSLLANIKVGQGKEDHEKKRLVTELRHKSTVAANLMHENERLIEENKQQAEYCDLLKEKLEIAEEAAAEQIGMQERKCEELTEELSAATEKNQQQEDICKMLKQQLQSVTEKMHQQELRCKQLENQGTKQREQELEQMLQKATAKTTQGAPPGTQGAQGVTTAEAEAAQSSPEKQQLEEMLKEALTTATTAEAKMSQQEERVRDLEKQLEKAMAGRDQKQEEVIEELQQQLKATEEAAIEVTQKQEERCRELEKQLQAATASFVSAISANREYEKQCLELQQQLEIVGKTASDSTEAIFAYEERCEELQAQVEGGRAAWEAAEQGRQKAEKRCRELEKKLQAAAAATTHESEQQEAYFKELQEQLQGATAAREEQEKQAEEAKEQLNAQRKENEELKTQLASLQQQTHILKVERTDELAVREQRIEELETTLAFMEDASQAETKDKTAPQEQPESPTVETVKEDQNVPSPSEREELKAQLTELEQKVLTLEIDRANLESELQMKLERIEDLENSLASLKTGKKVVRAEKESKPALSAFRSLVRSLKRLEKPLLELDVKQVNPQIKATSRVVALEDGGALLVDWSNKPHKVVRIDHQGNSTGPGFTCPSNSVLCGIVVHEDSVFTLQKDGTICQCSTNSLAEAKAKYKVDAGSLRDGLALDSNRLVLVDQARGEVFIYHLSEKRKESKVKGLNKPTGITQTKDVDGVVNFVITENGANRLVIYSDTWELRRSVGSFGPGDGQLNGPQCTIVSPEGNLLVADYGNHRVSEFTAAGRFLRHCLTRKEGLRHLQCIYLSHPFLWVAYFDGNKYNVKRFKMYEK